jgi:putative ABC transport system ATP-binding protein
MTVATRTPVGATAPAPVEPTPELAARAAEAVKVYGAGDTEVRALDSVTVGFERGRLTAIMGPSGSGKSTLLHCLAGLDSLTSGSVFVGDTDLTTLDDRALTLLRRERIGFVFQAFNLIPTLTAEENITLPLALGGRKPDPQWLATIVESLRLGDRLRHRPSELSGGQQQRIASARAMVTSPELIFADEPTGNLDSKSATDLLDLTRAAVDGLGQTVVMVTHDARAASYADRVLFLADGRIVTELRSPSMAAILDQLKALES